MKVTVKLFATFREGRFKVEELECPTGTTCRDVVGAICVREEELGIVLVNSRHAALDQALNDGDILSLFPLVGGG